MGKKSVALILILIVFALILMVLAGVSACSNSPNKSNSLIQSNAKDQRISQDDKSETKSADLHIVSENICVKDGENYEDKTILTNTDFIGFKYSYSESQKELFIYFKLTSEGQKKQDEVTKKFVEVPGFLSVWIGDELICTTKILSHITNDEFVLSVPDINEENVEAVIDKLEGNLLTDVQ